MDVLLSKEGFHKDFKIGLFTCIKDFDVKLLLAHWIISKLLTTSSYYEKRGSCPNDMIGPVEFNVFWPQSKRNK